MRTLTFVDAQTPPIVFGMEVIFLKDAPGETVMIAGREHFEGDMATARQSGFLADERFDVKFPVYVSPLGELIEVEGQLFPIALSDCAMCGRFPAPYRECSRFTPEENAAFQAIAEAQAGHFGFIHPPDEYLRLVFYQQRTFCEKHRLPSDTLDEPELGGPRGV